MSEEIDMEDFDVSGVVVRCRCGAVMLAMNTYETLGNIQMATMRSLSEWVAYGYTVEPQFGKWSTRLDVPSACKCDKDTD